MTVFVVILLPLKVVPVMTLLVVAPVQLILKALHDLRHERFLQLAVMEVVQYPVQQGAELLLSLTNASLFILDD